MITNRQRIECLKMENQVSSKRNSHVYLIYTIIFMIISLVAFSPVLIERRSLISTNDAFNQYYCVFCYIGRWIREGFSGGFKLYDTEIGYGESVIGALNYYGLGDILVMPFLCSRRNIFTTVFHYQL